MKRKMRNRRCIRTQHVCAVIFKRNLKGLNSDFSFSYTGCHFSLPFYIPRGRGRIVGFLVFPRVLALWEIQSRFGFELGSPYLFSNTNNRSTTSVSCVCTCIFMYTCMCVYIRGYIFMYVSMYVCMCIRMYKYMYIYVCIYGWLVRFYGISTCVGYLTLNPV